MYFFSKIHDSPKISLKRWAVSEKRLELCSGGELFDRIVADGKFTEQVAAYCVQQMLRAVNYMHINGIMHRLKLREVGPVGKGSFGQSSSEIFFLEPKEVEVEES